MSKPDSLFLIDASGLIFRAYFGLKTKMNAPDGTPTNAVFGYTRLLLNLLRGRSPSHIAAVFDSHGPSFRAKIDPHYKANRPPLAEDMRPQLPLCREVTKALGISTIELQGYEADDLIGTLATRWAKEGKECMIVTADKDLQQLISPEITLWDGKDKETRREEVLEKYGIAPEQMIDWLAISGDSADNIPGVPGIGPKGATELLSAYGTLENILAHASEIKGKRGQNLVTYADQARVCQKLTTIVKDAPLDATFEDLRYHSYDKESLYACFSRLGFERFIKEFGLTPKETENVSEKAEVIEESADGLTVESEEDLEKAKREIEEAKQVSIYFKMDFKNPFEAEIFEIGLCAKAGRNYRCPMKTDLLSKGIGFDAFLSLMSAIFEDKEIKKMGANLKPIDQILRRAGQKIEGFSNDASLAAYLLEPTRKKFELEDLIEEDLQISAPKGSFDAGRLAEYALRLCEIYEERLKKAGLWEMLQSLELPLSDLLARMELEGIHLEPEVLKKQSEAVKSEIETLESKIYEEAGKKFSIDSPKQLSEVLFQDLQLPTRKKNSKTGTFSTDQSVLEELSEFHPLPSQVLEYRHLVKLKNTYLDSLPKLIRKQTGRLHTFFNQVNTSTGRLSSSEPNLQNIPVRSEDGKAIRRAFTAEPGNGLLSADYSQIELRLLAHYSQDPGLCSAFLEGADIHRRTAAQLFKMDESEVTDLQRSRAKALGFGLMYGMSAFRLAKELSISREEAKQFIERYFEQYAGVKNYIDRAIEDARKTGYSRTLFGRIRKIEDLDNKNAVIRQAAERLAINTPIQGTAADILKRAMLNLDRRISKEGLKARMLLTVHDEVVLEMPLEEILFAQQIVEEEMTTAVSLRVPLKVSIGTGQSWADIH